MFAFHLEAHPQDTRGFSRGDEPQLWRKYRKNFWEKRVFRKENTAHRKYTPPFGKLLHIMFATSGTQRDVAEGKERGGRLSRRVYAVSSEFRKEALRSKSRAQEGSFPRSGNRSKRWNESFQGLEQAVPRHGTDSFKAWNKQFQGLGQILKHASRSRSRRLRSFLTKARLAGSDRVCGLSQALTSKASPTSGRSPGISGQVRKKMPPPQAREALKSMTKR